MRATFVISHKIIWQDCHIFNVGSHGHIVDLQLQDLRIKNITLTMGIVNTNTTPILLKKVASGKINFNQPIAHHFKLDDI